MKPIAFLAALLPAPLAALDLALPVACTPGADCYIQQAFDHDPGPGARDAACGPLTYDGHDGTDFALPTLAEQARGVAVLAAAPGVVRGVRDGMADALAGSPGAPDIAGRDCGNGVLVDHGEGWETQYCHLAQGSVAVAEGERVEAGTPLGLVGYSGRAEFPHLHLSLRRDGVPVDPFSPEAEEGACAPDPSADLWTADVPFPAGGLTDAGFATRVPDYDAVKAGTADEAPAAEAPLVLFALLYGGRAGDELLLLIEGPDGAPVHEHREVLERTQALLFRASGLRAPGGGWTAGAYAGEAVLLRDGKELDRLAVTAVIP